MVDIYFLDTTEQLYMDYFIAWRTNYEVVNEMREKITPGKKNLNKIDM